MLHRPKAILKQLLDRGLTCESRPSVRIVKVILILNFESERSPMRLVTAVRVGSDPEEGHVLDRSK